MLPMAYLVKQLGSLVGQAMLQNLVPKFKTFQKAYALNLRFHILVLLAFTGFFSSLFLYRTHIILIILMQRTMKPNCTYTFTCAIRSTSTLCWVNSVW